MEENQNHKTEEEGTEFIGFNIEKKYLRFIEEEAKANERNRSAQIRLILKEHYDLDLEIKEKEETK